MRKTVLAIMAAFAAAAAAEVKVSVNPAALYRGEKANFTITAEGGDIEFPKIDTIGGYRVLGVSSSRSIQINNSKVSKKSTRTYTFEPESSLTIPSYTVRIDGRDYATKELKVDVVKPAAGRGGDDFVVEIKADKDEVYVGEPVDLSISFKQKVNVRADRVEIGEPKLNNFWVKKVGGVDTGREGEYLLQTLHYRIFPQKPGEFDIGPVEAAVGKFAQMPGGAGGIFDDPFFRAMRMGINWKKIYSNGVKLKVKALPEGLELYGRYTIEAVPDKRTVHAGKPVNLTVRIKGTGNIDDIRKYDPQIENVVVYADEPRITTAVTDAAYGGEFVQKIAFVAENNFTIPSLSLKFFDSVDKSVKTVRTEPIAIEVIGGKSSAAAAAPVLQTAPAQRDSSAPKKPKEQTSAPARPCTGSDDEGLKYVFLLAGFGAGLLSFYLFGYFRSRFAKRESDMVSAIKRAKRDRELFDLLLPYAKKDRAIAEALAKLEGNIYKGESNKIDRELLMEIFEEEA